MQRSLDDLIQQGHSPACISVDVFDTLLLRNSISLRSRILAGETGFARHLNEQGWQISANTLVRVRLLAEKVSYRCLNLGGMPGEVRFVDIIDRQLEILGLPKQLIDARMAIEMAIEKKALVANETLARWLRKQRESGTRIVAISDTGLSAAQVSDLIEHFHGSDLIDRVYSSADLRMSKRSGELFSFVLNAEGVTASNALHIGDDERADHLVPGSLGIKTLHIPKPPIKRLQSRLDGAVAETRRRLHGVKAETGDKIPTTHDPLDFGRSVFGPILAEFCMMLWFYGQQASSDDAVMLFCARGGIGIREAFERFLQSLKLQLPIKRETLLVSRLIAARSAIAVGSSVVLDELAREFHGDRFIDVANSLGGRTYELPSTWQTTFDKYNFYALLETEAGKAVANDIQAQNELFKRHLDQVTSGNEKRLILCDTGLYGSTQRLLAAGLPDRNWETVQFARCNYKGLSEDHFGKVAGLVVENRFYQAFNNRTVVLRYWQLVESLFEPAIPSVKHLSLNEFGDVIANSGEVRYGAQDPASHNALLRGALQYIDALTDAHSIMTDAEQAWRRLKWSIVSPSGDDLSALGSKTRSIDFGRAGTVEVVLQQDDAKLSKRLASIRSQLWKEGAIAHHFPRMKLVLLPALELTHAIRGLSSGWRT